MMNATKFTPAAEPSEYVSIRQLAADPDFPLTLNQLRHLERNRRNPGGLNAFKVLAPAGRKFLWHKPTLLKFLDSLREQGV